MTKEDKIPKESNLNACCFTGHRPDKLRRSEAKVAEDLRQAIRQAVTDGYLTFITGMAPGVDIVAGEIVLKLRNAFPSLRLIAAIPYHGFEKRWDDEWKARFTKLLENADEAHYIALHCFKGVSQVRNMWMVDRSSRVIAVYNGEKGGTKNTINYARRKNVPVVYIDG